MTSPYEQSKQNSGHTTITGGEARCKTIKASHPSGRPDGDDDVINKYGTYEIQRTNGMENPYPMIAQGLSEQEAQEQLNAAERWKKK